jgi:hypothetical protein
MSQVSTFSHMYTCKKIFFLRKTFVLKQPVIYLEFNCMLFSARAEANETWARELLLVLYSDSLVLCHLIPAGVNLV